MHVGEPSAKASKHAPLSLKRITISEQAITLGVALILSCAYAAEVCWRGVPAFRHDWVWPNDHAGFIAEIWSATSGWNTAGIGSPAPYPGAYILGTLIGVAGLIVGSFPALILYTVFVGAAISIGARNIATSFNASTVLVVGVELFAIFNPWVYNKTVAGHEYMVLAYGGFLLILAELLRPTPGSKRNVALLLILVLPQIQFFIATMLVLLAYAVVRKSYLPVITGAILSLPLSIGMAFERGSLLHTPYTLAWEKTQSVPPQTVLSLSGYFAKYASHFNSVQIIAVWGVFACACLSLILSQRRPLVYLLVPCATFVAILAMGTRGPIGTSYATLVLGVPESGIFRELYDLLGFMAAAYVVALSTLPRRSTYASFFVLISSMIMATAWLTFPPSNYWLNREKVPTSDIKGATNARFALFPAYQPMQYLGKGSGADPDAYARPDSLTPINEYLARYPVNAALSAFQEYGDRQPLEALSVSFVALRPWFNTDRIALREQLSGLPPERMPANLKRLNAEPEVELGEVPAVGTLVNVLGSGNIFFDDARSVDSQLAPPFWRSLPPFLSTSGSNEFVDDKDGWVASDFDFASNPRLGQGLGGAVTTSRSARLQVRRGLPTLVNINGDLLSQDGKRITSTTGGYKWIVLPSSVRSLRCAGRCVVVGQADTKVPFPLNPRPRHFTPLPFAALTPWLIRVDLPAHRRMDLRYNAAFDPNWTIFGLGREAVHVRLDSVVNGWLLDNSRKPHVLYIYQRTALLQMIAELIGIAWAVVLALSLIDRNRVTVLSTLVDKPVSVHVNA